jgi:hypothetical protein
MPASTYRQITSRSAGGGAVKTDLGLRCVEPRPARRPAPAADEHHLLGGAVDVDEHGRSIEQSPLTSRHDHVRRAMTPS